MVTQYAVAGNGLEGKGRKTDSGRDSCFVLSCVINLIRRLLG